MDCVALGSHYASRPLEPLAGAARRGVCAAMQTWVRPDPGSARPRAVAGPTPAPIPSRLAPLQAGPTRSRTAASPVRRGRGVRRSRHGRGRPDSPPPEPRRRPPRREHTHEPPHTHLTGTTTLTPDLVPPSSVRKTSVYPMSEHKSDAHHCKRMVRLLDCLANRVP